jgi:hypothetical protein
MVNDIEIENYDFGLATGVTRFELPREILGNHQTRAKDHKSQKFKRIKSFC